MNIYYIEQLQGGHHTKMKILNQKLDTQFLYAFRYDAYIGKADVAPLMDAWLALRRRGVCRSPSVAELVSSASASVRMSRT